MKLVVSFGFSLFASDAHTFDAPSACPLATGAATALLKRQALRGATLLVMLQVVHQQALIFYGPDAHKQPRYKLYPQAQAFVGELWG